LSTLPQHGRGQPAHSLPECCPQPQRQEQHGCHRHPIRPMIRGAFPIDRTTELIGFGVGALQQDFVVHSSSVIRCAVRVLTRCRRRISHVKRGRGLGAGYPWLAVPSGSACPRGRGAMPPPLICAVFLSCSAVRPRQGVIIVQQHRASEGAASGWEMINTDAALRAGLGPARSTKPGVILRVDSQRTVHGEWPRSPSPGHAEQWLTWLKKISKLAECEVIDIPAITRPP